MTRPWPLGLLLLGGLVLGGCSSVVVQSAWWPTAEGSHRVRQRYDDVLPPLVRIPLRPPQRVDVQLCVTTQGVYEVLTGPIVFPVVPMGLFSWMWAPGLSETSLDLELLVHGPEGQTRCDPQQFVLRASDGRRLVPRVAERVRQRPERLGMLVSALGPGRRSPISPQLQPFHLVVRYDLPDDIDRLELALGGIVVGDEEQRLPLVVLQRDSRWRFVAPVDT